MSYCLPTAALWVSFWFLSLQVLTALVAPKTVSVVFQAGPSWLPMPRPEAHRAFLFPSLFLVRKKGRILPSVPWLHPSQTFPTLALTHSFLMCFLSCPCSPCSHADSRWRRSEWSSGICTWLGSPGRGLILLFSSWPKATHSSRYFFLCFLQTPATGKASSLLKTTKKKKKPRLSSSQYQIPHLPT